MNPILLLILEIVGAVALPFIIERMVRWYLKRKKLGDFSHVFPLSDKPRSMTVKCSVWRTMGGEPPQTVRAYVHSAELLALKEVTSMLEPLGVEVNMGSFYGPPTSATKLLLIGSGAHIDYSKAVMDEKRRLGRYSCVYPAGDHFHFELPDQPPFTCKHIEKGKELQVSTDYGLIVRIRVAGRDILLLAGIHMHGTLAAARIALSPEFHAKVKREKCRSFAQMVRVDVEQTQGLETTAIHWKDYPLCEVDDL